MTLKQTPLQKSLHHAQSAWSRLRQTIQAPNTRLMRVMRVLLGAVLGVYLVFCLVFLGFGYIVLPKISNYKSGIENRLSLQMGRQITISGIEGSMNRLQPVLKLADVRVHDGEGNVALKLENVRAALSLWSFFVFDLRFASLEINRPELDVRRDEEGNLHVAGFTANPDARDQGGNADWVFRQGLIVIRDGTVRWTDELRGVPAMEVSQINFALENSGRRHRLRLLAQTEFTGSGEIDIRADFVHPFFAQRISDMSAWRGDLYVALPATNLEPWMPYIDFIEGLKKGEGSLSAWVSLDRARIADLTIDVNLSDTILQIAPDLPELSFDRFSGRILAKELFEARSDADHLEIGKRPHSIALRNISFESADGIRMNDVDFSHRFIPATDAEGAIHQLSVNHLDISTLSELARYLPIPAEGHRLLKDFAPSGVLNSFNVQWAGNFPEIASYSVDGQFVDVSVSNLPVNLPFELPRTDAEKKSGKSRGPLFFGFKNLSGRISANETGGLFELDSNKATFDVASFFQKPEWIFDDLRVQTSWSRSFESPLALVIDKIGFSVDGASVSAAGRFDITADEAGKHSRIIDLTASVRHFDMTHLKNFVPSFGDDDVREWLSLAFEGGSAQNATARLKGDLSRFPFRDEASLESGSEFSVLANVSDVILNYAPKRRTDDGRKEWPHPIDKIMGRVKIAGSRIEIHADSAQILGVALSDVSAVIPDILAKKETRLEVDGKAHGLLPDFVAYVNDSHIINKAVGGLLEEAQSAGQASLLLNLELYLGRMKDSRVKGALTFAQNEITLFPDLPVLTKVGGSVHFTDEGFNLENINAQFLGGGVSLAGSSVKGGHYTVNGSGTLTAEGVRTNYAGSEQAALLKRLSGSASYTVSITRNTRLPNISYPDIVVETSAGGFGIDFPYPLGKKSAEVRPLRVTVSPLAPVRGSMRDEIKVSFGPAMSAHYVRQKEKRRWLVTRAGISVSQPVDARPDLFLRVNVPHLDYDQWMEVIGPYMSETPAQARPARRTTRASAQGTIELSAYVVPEQFTIRSDVIKSAALDLTGTYVRGVRQGSRWNLDVDSKEVRGQLIWFNASREHANGLLKANLVNLFIPKSAPQRAEDVIYQERVRELPAIEVTAEHFSLFDMPLGSIELTAKNVARPPDNVWEVSRLKIKNPDAELRATGNWIINRAGVQKTQMHYELDIHNAGKTLDRVEYKGVLSGGSGKMQGDLGWAGLPYSMDYASLSGKFELNIDRGKFIKVEPGVVRLLGVLSLQSLPRRFTLDFSDLFAEGFAFDRIAANAGITDGVLTTENLTMSGVSATVLMKGSVDITKETQNLNVTILPEINVGAASLAYTLINPAIGVGTFLAQMFLRNPLAKTFTHEYQITGPWKDPDIKRIYSGQASAAARASESSSVTEGASTTGGSSTSESDNAGENATDGENDSIGESDSVAESEVTAESAGGAQEGSEEEPDVRATPEAPGSEGS